MSVPTPQTHTRIKLQFDGKDGIWTTLNNGERGTLIARLSYKSPAMASVGGLLAAAPELLVALRHLKAERDELLEALEECVPMLDHAARTLNGMNIDGDYFSKMRRAKAAIAKATGGAS